MIEKILRFAQKRIILIIFIILYLLFSLFTYKDYGISFDERDVYLRGKLLYLKIKGNDPTLQEDFVINKGSFNEGLRFYNHAYPALLYALNDKESYKTYYLLNLIFALPLFIALFELLLYKFKDPKKAILGPIFLFFTPYFLGNIPINPKDIPFATAYFLSLSFIALSKKLDFRIKTLLLGFSFGLAVSLRTIGFSVFLVYFVYELAFLKKPYFKKIVFTALETSIIFLLAFLVLMISIPYIGADPFNHFLELLRISKNFPWQGDVLFQGKFYPVQNLPWHYLLTWIVITTPIVFLLLFLFYSTKLTSKDLKADLPFLLALAINLFLYFTLKPTIYDGYRHFLFLAPIIIYLASCSFIKLARTKFKTWVKIAMALNIGTVAFSYIKLHPYEYIYFNAIAGGLKGAYGKYEIDYWNTTSTEAVKWLVNWMDKKEINKLNVKIFGTSTPLYVYGKGKLKETDLKKADIIITWERNNDHKKARGKLIYKVERQGVPLVYIYYVGKNKK